MSNFLLTVCKGIYPPYLVLVVWGVAAKLRGNRWRKFDTLLCAGFLLFELLAALQVWLFYGDLATSKRYLWIGLPLYLPFAAAGIVSLGDWLKGFRSGDFLRLILLIALAAVSLYNFLTPVTREYRTGAKRRRRLAVLTAAKWIRNDRERDRVADRPPVMYMKCDRYQSGRRPLVRSSHKLSRVGYLCGGQEHSELFASLGIPPDYIVSNAPENAPGYDLVEQFAIGKYEVYIYKAKRRAP